MTTNQKLTTPVNRSLWRALLVGLVGLAGAVIGALTGSLDRFFQSYLLAFLFWLGLSLGGLAFLMIHFLTGNRWGLAVRRINEAAANTLWLMAILFIPLLFNLKALYLWARPEAVQADAILQHKSQYLNVPFFIIRAAVYFAVWILLAFIINRLSARWANSGDPAIKSRLQGLGAFGLIVYTITMTFAAIDWVLSLTPFWNSTIFGLITIFGQLLSALAFAIMVLNLVPGLGLGRNWGFRSTPIPFKDLGALLLTFVMSWAYLAYFQLLIIWAGNIPHEVSWYSDRTTGGWLIVGILIAVLQFALPFVLLISMRVRHNLRILAWISGLLVFVSLVNIYWHIIPTFHPGQFNLHWLDIVLPIGLGGIWIGAFLFALKRRPALSEAEQTSLAPAAGHEPSSS